MTYVNEPFAQPWRRRLVLALAVSLGLAVAATRTAAPVDAAPVPSLAQSETPAAAGPPPAAAPKAPAAPKADESNADESAPAEAADGPDAESTVTIDSHGIGILKNGKRVTVRGFGVDREYDSFQDFMNQAPALAAFVFMIVLTVFLTPLLIVALLVWYKIRKARMQNETMLKLAEKGVVPPAEAMAALTQPLPPGAQVPPSAMPLYEQARQVRRRTAWSDLRKGVVVGAIGLGLTLFSMLDDGSPNSVGLVCLFVGLGYCLLWYFEDRPVQRDAGAPPGGGA
jgi:hypothetical protein